MSADHHHYRPENNRGLSFAVFINLSLTLFQFIGGILSGSLSLLADAVHNLSDAASLGIALFARKISLKPADEAKTFGYQRAEVIAALINTTLLITISLYLIYEAFWRLLEPQVIAGSIIIFVASIALIIDIITAIITFKKSKNNMNMKAAFLHNLSDGLSSIGVIIAGLLIFLYKIYWIDTLLTFLVAGFILWQAIKLLPNTIHLLMEGSPKNILPKDIKESIKKIVGIKDIHHIHIWHLDENRIAMEANVIVTANRLSEVEPIKEKIKNLLKNNFNIVHSTLEFEHYKDSKSGERN
jgi:cobalt-zinc-cadmium efflux system protein